MNTINLDVQYRPIRIGWCINDDLNEYKKALRLTHTLWGGFANPIIPVNESNLAKKLVDFFKVDVLFPVSNENNIINFIEKFDYLPWPFYFDKSLFIKWGLPNKPMNEAAFLDIFQAAIKLSSSLKRGDSEWVTLNIAHWENDDPLSSVFEAMFGAFAVPEEINIDFDYSKLIGHCLKINDINLKMQEKIPASIFQAWTINRLTKYSLKRKARPGWDSPGFYIGHSDNINDLIHFWNLRACGISLVFYDDIYRERFLEIKNHFINAFEKNHHSDYEDLSKIGIWTSNKDDTLDYSKFIENPIVYKIDLNSWNGLNIKNSYTYFEPKSVLGVLSDSFPKTISFQLPSKPIEEDLFGENQYLVATIRVYGEINDSEYTFNTPYIPQLNPFYGTGIYHNKARVELDGIGFIVDNKKSSMYLESIKITELFQAIFKKFGMDISASLPGIKASRLIKQMGGLQDCRIFKIKGVRDIIKKYLPHESFHKSEAIKLIGELDLDTGKPNFDRYKNLYISPRPIGTDLTQCKVFNYMLSKNIFMAGIELLCPNCNINFWKMIDNLKTNTECEYCAVSFNILTQLKDKNWAYRRSGIFGLNDNQEGAIPVALTLQQLDQNFHRGLTQNFFMYTTAMEIKPGFSSINKCETDFIIITSNREGELSIVISECKGMIEIKDNDVNNLIKIADVLQNYEINAYILFSKLDEFTQIEIERCRKANMAYRDRVIMLTSPLLESYHIYDNFKGLCCIKEKIVKKIRYIFNFFSLLRVEMTFNLKFFLLPLRSY